MCDCIFDVCDRTVYWHVIDIYYRISMLLPYYSLLFAWKMLIHGNLTWNQSIDLSIRHIDEGADYYTITANFKIHTMLIQIMRFIKWTKTNKKNFKQTTLSAYSICFYPALLAYFSNISDSHLCYYSSNSSEAIRIYKSHAV